MRFFSTFGLSLLLWLPTHLTEATPLVENHEDRVKSLPGYDAPLPSPWYSGFLEYELEGQAIKTHYILVEAEDIRPERTTPTPLIYWSNGGPGASSLFGLMTELGPLILSDDSVKTEGGLPTAIYNHNSWTRIGHILIFDAPAPVGFSQCGDEQTKACVSWTDELASQNAYLALQTFFTKKFPVLQQTPLYLTGESYAGIYIPTLARRIVEDTDFVVNLQGFAVGDGCLGTETGICGSLSGSRINFWHVIFLAGHGQVPLTTLQIVMDACKADMKIGFTARETDACDDALKLLKTQVGGYYEYALYDECTYRNGLMGSSVAGALNDYPCGGGDVLEAYVKLDVVKKALNIPSSSTFFSVDNAENFDYTPTEKDLTGFYISQTDKLRMLVYNGDTDPAITSFAAQNWTSSLGLEVTQDWRPWTLDECQRVGGYVTRYAGGLDFLTIRGAGHLVPTYKPEAAFSFMKSWIEGKEYPQYKPDCKKPPQQQGQLDTVVVAPEGETQEAVASVSSSLRG